ncbi:MAG: S-layer homology domain-containing protein [Leptolyngbya sp. IPPAS B-1204]|nr:MAG: S-layer homology domain-containing protein [Leptolyngbya sp. IPPAS B-1204]
MAGQPPSPGSDRRDPLSFDELVALIVAFLVIGAVLWWSLGRRAETWLGQLSPGLTRSEAEPSPLDPAQRDTVEVAPVGPTAGPTTPSPLPPGTVGGTVDRTTVGVSPAPRGPRTVIIPAVPGLPRAAESEASPAVPSPSPQVAPQVVVPSPSPEAAVNFPDLSPNYWAYPFIAELARRGMISGFEDGSFRPDQPVTRTQYATLVGEVLPDVRQESQAFPDVPVNFWGKPAIDEAVKSGFLRGYPDTSFQPNQPISRMEVLLSLVNGFQLPKPADPAAPLQVFQDRDQIPEWARPAVAAATQANVAVSHPNVNQFNPNQPATRAEVAAMLYQALTTTGQLPPIQSNYIVRP